MHGYYLHYRDIYDENRKQTGIDQKVKDQVGALNDAGISCEFKLCKQPESIPGMVLSCLPGLPDRINWPAVEALSDADFLYIRQPRFVSKEMLAFLKEFKNSNPTATVIYEVPTFPYDDPLKTVKTYAALLKDRKYRKHLIEYVDRISDLSGTDEIFGIPTIQFSNGINMARIKPKKTAQSMSEVHLMCVAYYGDWHGMDRMIKGLHRYYEDGGTRKIVLHLAGAGDTLSTLKNLTGKYGLGEHVVFPGIVSGKELDDLYDGCSFAVGALGFHRYGDVVAASLKTREYLAKGIPFIYEGEVDVFQKEPLDYCWKVPYDDSPIDIEAFLAFHDEQYQRISKDDMVEMIRAYAERHVSMRSAMSEVVAYLEKHGERVAANGCHEGPDSQ